MDEPWVTFTVSTASRCDLRRLPDTIFPFDFAFAFTKGTPRWVVDMFTKEVRGVQDEGISTKLIEQFIRFPGTGCNPQSTNSETGSVKFNQVSKILHQWRRNSQYVALWRVKKDQ